MRHRKKGRKLGRERDQRRVLIKSLCRSFILSGKIKTTEAKAKEMRPVVERLITRAKKNTLVNRRYAARYLDSKAVKKLFSDIGPRYISRPGGYTRIVKLGPRKGDAAKEAIIELVK